MKNLTIGIIPFLNCEPFYSTIGAMGWRLRRAPPKQLGLLAEEGQIDAACMSLLDTYRLSSFYEPLGLWGISACQQVYSIILLSKAPIWELNAGVISATEKTATSIGLLEVLMKERYRIAPNLESRDYLSEQDQGRLLIGDDALAATANGIPGFSYVTDLASEWWQWKRAPFVFARWVVKKDLPERKKQLLNEWLGQSLAVGLKSIPSIASQRAAELGLSEELIVRYLTNFRYELGHEELMGMEEFLRLWSGIREREASVKKALEFL